MPNATATNRATDRSEEDAIVAHCQGCKRMIFATGTDPLYFDAKVKREIGEMVAEGYLLSRMKTKEVRESAWGCKCPKTGELPL